MDSSNRRRVSLFLVFGVFLALASDLAAQQNRMAVSVDAHGRYVLGASDAPTLVSGVAAEIDGRWVHSNDYPQHAIEESSA